MYEEAIRWFLSGTGVHLSGKDPFPMYPNPSPAAAKRLLKSTVTDGISHRASLQWAGVVSQLATDQLCRLQMFLLRGWCHFWFLPQRHWCGEITGNFTTLNILLIHTWDGMSGPAACPCGPPLTLTVSPYTHVRQYTHFLPKEASRAAARGKFISIMILCHYKLFEWLQVSM